MFQYSFYQLLVSGEKRDHFLDHAKKKYDGRLIQDIKDVMKVLTLYMPLPLFWALFDQQVSEYDLIILF